MGQLLLVWLMHVSWVMATSVHDIYLPLMRRWPRKFTTFLRHNYLKLTSWSYKVHQTNTSDKEIFPKIFPEFAHILPKYSPNLPTFGTKVPPASVSYAQFHYTSSLKPEIIHSNLLSNITRHWVEAVDMIFFHSHHYNLQWRMYNWDLSRGYFVFSASRLFHVRPWPRLISPEILSHSTCYDFNQKKIYIY